MLRLLGIPKRAQAKGGGRRVEGGGGRRRKEAEGRRKEGGRRTPSRKSKNPTQRCGEKHLKKHKQKQKYFINSS